MKKLTIEHLAPYLPYRVKFQWKREDGEIITNDLTVSDYNFIMGKHAIPILRPMSDLTKEIEVNGEKFVPADNFDFGCDEVYWQWKGDGLEYYDCDDEDKSRVIEMISPDIMSCTSWGTIQKLFSWHFDVFGLIQDGLAIDINTVNP